MKKFVCLMMLPLALVTTNANARPYPDKLGVCYFFSGNKLKQKTPCVVAAGYGAGAMYTSLQIGKRNYYFETNTMTEDGQTTYKGKPVHEYTRDASFYRVLTDKELETAENEELLFCYRTRDKKLDICYSSND